MNIDECLSQLESADLNDSLKYLASIDSFFQDNEDIDEKHVHALIQCLGHKIWYVRSKLFNLFRDHQDKVYPYLSDYLSDDNVDIQFWAIQIYCTVSQEYFEYAQNEKDTTKSKKYLKFVDRNVKRLISVYPEIAEANQLIILSGLSKISYSKLISFFAEQLKSNTWVIRNESAKGLIEIGDASVPSMKKLILEGTKDQCYWAFRVLGTLLGEKSLDPFYRVIQSTDYADEVRVYALAGIKQIGGEAIIPYLIRCLSSDLWVIRAQASETLIGFQGSVTDNLLQCLAAKDQNVRYWALKTLSEVVSEEDISKIEPFVSQKDQELRFYTITALKKIGSHRAVEVIASCFNDDAWLIRKHAADCLIEIGEASVRPLMNLLKLSQDNDETIFWAVQVLSSLKIETVIPALVQFLSSDNKNFRLYAVRGIGQIPTESALHQMMKVFSNDLWVVRQEAFRVLQRLNDFHVFKIALSYINYEDDSVYFWCSKLIKESNYIGAVALSEEFEKLDTSEIKKLSVLLDELQDRYLEDLLSSPTASIATLTKLATDPFKLKDASKAVVHSPVTPSVVPYQPIPTQDLQSNPSANLFHFEDNNYQKYDSSLDEILDKMVLLGGSDLHIKVGQPPMVRVNGKIQSTSLPVISVNQIKDLFRNSFSVFHQRKFCDDLQLDCSYTSEGLDRFRVNLYYTHLGIEAAFRHVKSVIPSFQDLGLPYESFEMLSSYQSGLVLITGVTGSGKTSSLASIIGAINQREQKHIITIEDPVEFIHKSKKCIISHRELGEHVGTFVDGIRGCLREDPDIVLVGEMRDTETVKAVLKLAGTGHMVYSTFHTSSAPQTIEQLIQYFPPDERQNICAQLTFCLKAVVSQTLVEDSKALSRVPVLEIMTANNAVKNMIREGKTEQLYSVMQTSSGDGMITRDKYLKQLYQQRRISRETYELNLQDKTQAFN
ncbi:MAG: PilT/PilU family type 4a pilus ATPase [Candidatus Cloacimonetes bacterium]|nr:PilT/PilU family type 4a pilus ATPase [Candidatus Cloacimonadota bacterium]